MKIKINDAFFYTAYLIFLFSCMFEAVTFILPILQFLKVFSLVILLGKFLISFKSGYKKKEYNKNYYSNDLCCNFLLLF